MTNELGRQIRARDALFIRTLKGATSLPPPSPNTFNDCACEKPFEK
jgi:hypothetical protein